MINNGTEKRKNKKTERLVKRHCNDPKCKLNRKGIRHGHGEVIRRELTPEEKAEIKSMEKKMGKACRCGHYEQEHLEKYEDAWILDDTGIGRWVREACRKCECDYYITTNRFF